MTSCIFDVRVYVSRCINIIFHLFCCLHKKQTEGYNDQNKTLAGLRSYQNKKKIQPKKSTNKKQKTRFHANTY